MSLLEKALTAVDRRRHAKANNDEEVELALAFYAGRITAYQAAFALGAKSVSTATARLGCVLRNACKLGLIVLERRL